jgi:hypothetical protein
MILFVFFFGMVFYLLYFVKHNLAVFYFRAPSCLVVLTFPQPVNFYSHFSLEFEKNEGKCE